MDLISRSDKCYYRGSYIPKGERFSAPRQYARALLAMKRAKPAPQTVQIDKPKRSYSTRVVRREDTETVVMQPSPFDHDGDGEAGASKSGGEDLTELRREYKEVVGKRAFPGWSADVLRAKMAAAQS